MKACGGTKHCEREANQNRTVDDESPKFRPAIRVARRPTYRYTAQLSTCEDLPMTLTVPSLIRRQIALYARRIRELESDLLRATTLLNEDCLTGMLNRRGLRQACDIYPLSVEIGVTVVSCAALDLDDFKGINDRHGHATGNAALVHFAQFLRMHMRPVDTMARLGGDEFVLIMAEMTGQDAIATLNRLVKALADSPLLTKDEPLLLSLSAGIAEWRADEAMNDALMRADAALLAAKRLGKGCVVFEA